MQTSHLIGMLLALVAVGVIILILYLSGQTCLQLLSSPAPHRDRLSRCGLETPQQP
jgi:hypothetical protein